MINVAIVNKSNTNPGFTMSKLELSLRAYLKDLSPVWGLNDVRVRATDTPTEEDWQIVLLDDADTANALGYHELTKSGLPLSKVFVNTTLNSYQGSVSATVAHEFAEMLLDPGVNILAKDLKTGRTYWFELCDAVQSGDYEVKGLQMSDFVYPSYFSGLPGFAKYSQRDTVNAPFKVAPGGYMSYQVDGSNDWNQQFGSKGQVAIGRSGEKWSLQNRHLVRLLDVRKKSKV